MRALSPILVTTLALGCSDLTGGASSRQAANLPAEQVETPNRDACDQAIDEALALAQITRNQPSWSYTMERWEFGCMSYQLMVEIKDTDPGDAQFQFIKRAYMCNMCEEKQDLDFQIDRDQLRSMSPGVFVSTSDAQDPRVWGWCPDELSGRETEPSSRTMTPARLQEITVTTRSHTEYTPSNAPGELAPTDTFIAWPLIRPQNQRTRSDLPEYYEGAGCTTWQLPVAGYESDMSRPRMAWQRIPAVPWPRDFQRVGVCTDPSCMSDDVE